MAPRSALAGLAALALARCAEERAAGPGQVPSLTEHGVEEANLREAVLATITVRPEGPGGPRETRTVDCSAHMDACGVVYRKDEKPSACTDVYGGPATATVSMEADGSVDKHRYSLENGCEIARWKRAARLLGAPPRR